MNNTKQNLQKIINQALLAIDPEKLTADFLNKNNIIGKYKHIYVIGFGKAGYKMALGAEKILGKKITKGLVNVPNLPRNNKLQKIKLQKACHPLPCQTGFINSKKILTLINSAKSNDLVLCLISGGGSALFTVPAKGITLKDLAKTFELLVKHTSATIQEINIIRKHLSQVKGGQLAKTIYPAKTISLIISDVMDSHLPSIASGPTVPDPSTFKQAWQVLNKYKLINKIPDSVKKHLQLGLNKKIPDTPTSRDRVFKNKKVINKIIGDNNTMLKAATSEAKKIGYQTISMSNFLQGEVRQSAKEFVELIKKIPPNTCLIAGGETVVKVRGQGHGGRNQEFALTILKLIPKNLLKNITLASFGTDGIDGFCPQPVAGALVNYNTYKKSQNKSLNINHYLNNNDSYTFFKKLNSHITTGPTGTNVGDIVIAMKK